MNGRRQFLKFLSCAPIIGGGAVIAAAAVAQERQPKTGEPHLIFTKVGAETHIAVGEQGTLWIGDGKTWRKVATE